MSATPISNPVQQVPVLLATAGIAQATETAIRGFLQGIQVPDLFHLITNHNPQASAVAGGGYCDLYIADMQGVGRVALKKMRILGTREASKKRFRHEARIWSTLQHKHILRFLGTYELDGWTYMVSEWQPRGSLPNYLNETPTADRLLLLEQICDALLYLHDERAYVHGDIKGQNVLVNTDGDSLLCDFGLSLTLDEAQIVSSVPSSLKAGGSMRYMAPELFQGVDKSPASDVFAFGMLILETVTGRGPFDYVKYEPAVMTNIMAGKRPERVKYTLFSGLECTPQMEDELWALMERCWRQEATERCGMRKVRHAIRVIRGVETETEDVDDGAIGESEGASTSGPEVPTGIMSSVGSESFKSSTGPRPNHGSLTPGSISAVNPSAISSMVPAPLEAPGLPDAADAQLGQAPPPLGEGLGLGDTLRQIAESPKLSQENAAQYIWNSYEGRRVQRFINTSVEDTRKELQRAIKRWKL